MPNGSFEEFNSCSQFLDNITDCLNWVNSRNSCDYFHSCGFNGVVTPSNVFGFQIPYHGIAYSGIAAYNSSSENYREHLDINWHRDNVQRMQLTRDENVTIAGHTVHLQLIQIPRPMLFT